MAVHKIQIIDFLSIDYELIAIHSSLEDYRLAYFLNRELSLRLCKNNLDIEITTSNGKSNFNHYFFDDEETDLQWSLIENKTLIKSDKKESAGFFDEIEVNAFLLPEFKKADFLLKIENVDSSFKTAFILQKIENINQVVLSYTIDQIKIKSKHNLIF